MPESSVNSRITASDQLCFLGTERIIGLQSINPSNNFAANPLIYAGAFGKRPRYIPRGEQNNIASINSTLINQDLFFNKVVSNNYHNIYLLKDINNLNNNYCLLNGYFSEYSMQYSIGNIPEINTTFISVGNAGQIPTGQFNATQMNDMESIVIQTLINNSDDWGVIEDTIHAGNSYDWGLITDSIDSSEDWNLDDYGYSFSETPYFNSSYLSQWGLKIPFGNSITLNIDDFTTNRLQEYSIDIKTNKKPIYHLGSRFPSRLELIYPIDVTCQFTFELGNYEAKKLRDFPDKKFIKQLTLEIKSFDTNEYISSYSFNSLNLINENFENNINNNISVTQTYNTKLYGS